MEKIYYEKILEVKKISKTREKGRIQRFKVVLIVGDKKGTFGIGVGKDLYLLEAINKAKKKAYTGLMFIDVNSFFKFINKTLFFNMRNVKLVVKFLLNKHEMVENSSVFKSILLIIGLNGIKVIQKKESSNILSKTRALIALLKLLSSLKSECNYYKFKHQSMFKFVSANIIKCLY